MIRVLASKAARPVYERLGFEASDDMVLTRNKNLHDEEGGRHTKGAEANSIDGSSWSTKKRIVARFAPALSGFVAIPNGVLAAAAAGMRQEIVSALGILQRALSRIALVRDGRCRKRAEVFRVGQRALKARYVY